MDVEEDRAFGDVIQELAQPVRKRDPRAVRLAAVTCAILDVVDNHSSASQVYAKIVATLEGTLTSESTHIADSLSTLVALLELLSTTVPYVSPPAILGATLPLTSRVLCSIVSSTQTIGDTVVLETKDELGGVNAVLRWVCRASSEVLKCLNLDADEKAETAPSRDFVDAFSRPETQSTQGCP